MGTFLAILLSVVTSLAAPAPVPVTRHAVEADRTVQPVSLFAPGLPGPGRTAVPLKAVFIGDSYTDKDGVPGARWADYLSANKRWTEYNLALGGTGYITPYIGPLGFGGKCPDYPGGLHRCPPFNEMAGPTAAIEPQIVFVFGGRNELGQEYDTAWRDGVRDLYAALRVAAPRAIIFGISPIWDDDPVPAGITEMQNVVRAAVQAVDHACYVDLHNPLLGRPELVAPDGIHPNEAGQEAIYNAVLANIDPTCWRWPTP